MTRIILIAAACLGLAACTEAQTTKVTAAETRVIVQGQLFCETKVNTYAPLVVAVANAVGAPVTVTNNTAAFVAAQCALVNGIPVPPPADTVNVPVVSTP